MNTRRKLLVALGVGALVPPFASVAQQPGKVYRIGFLRVAAPPDAYIEAFRQGLKELGYLEGKNIAFEYRWAGYKRERLPTLAADLVGLQVDIIFTDGGSAAGAARDATRTIPIVMASAGDPVAQGLIASLARPGGNLTGLTSMNLNLGGKLLDVLKDIVPKLGHVGILRPVGSPAGDRFLKNTEMPAQALKIKITPLIVRGPEDYESVFQTATKERIQALVVSAPITAADDRKRIIDLAARNRLPAIYESRDWVASGGLISYGPDRVDMYRRTAMYVHKILKGAKPADLPIEQPMKFELFINGKTAKTLGLAIPQSLLIMADKVIE